MHTTFCTCLEWNTQSNISKSILVSIIISCLVSHSMLFWEFINLVLSLHKIQDRTHSVRCGVRIQPHHWIDFNQRNSVCALYRLITYAQQNGIIFTPSRRRGRWSFSWINSNNSIQFIGKSLSLMNMNYWFSTYLFGSTHCQQHPV